MKEKDVNERGKTTICIIEMHEQIMRVNGLKFEL